MSIYIQVLSVQTVTHQSRTREWSVSIMMDIKVDSGQQRSHAGYMWSPLLVYILIYFKSPLSKPNSFLKSEFLTKNKGDNLTWTRHFLMIEMPHGTPSC